MSSSPVPRLLSGRRLRLALTLGAALVLLTAPVVQGANATNINIQLPAGFSIKGTVRDNTGAALAGANVFASGTLSGAYGSASTNASGQYTLSGLIATSYTIYVGAPTAKNLVDGYYTTANANHHTPNGASATKVTVGPNKTGIDVKLPVGLTISGMVTTTTGTPLQGAIVGGSGPSFDSMVTGADGKYQLKGFAAGSYRLSVSAPSNSNYQSGYYTTANANHFAIAFPSASAIAIGPSKTGVNIKLPTGYTISGTIKNTSGTAQQYIQISPSSTTYSGRAASTDAAGKYTIKGLAAGTYKLGISPGSDSPLMDGYYTTTNTNHFTSAIGGASGVVVGPSKANVNANIVTGRTISGKITDTANVPQQYAYISATNLGHTRSAETDAAGNYTIRGLSSAPQKLQVEPPYGPNLMSGYYTSANSNHFTSKESGATALTVPPNKTGINIKIVKGYSISGKITKAGGVAVSFAFVDATKSDYSGYASTEADGTYTITGLGSGTYMISVSSYGENLQSGYYTTANSAHFTVNPASATGVTIGP